MKTAAMAVFVILVYGTVLWAILRAPLEDEPWWSGFGRHPELEPDDDSPTVEEAVQNGDLPG